MAQIHDPEIYQTLKTAIPVILVVVILLYELIDNNNVITLRERNRGARDAAQKEGCEYVRRLKNFFLCFSESEYLTKGWFRQYYNLIRGKNGIRDFYFFDFKQTIFPLSDSFYTRFDTICIIRDNFCKIPSFKLIAGPERNENSQGNEIYFQDGSRFSKRFFLTGKDEHLIRHLFNQEMMEFFNRYKNSDVVIEVFDNCLLFTRGGFLPPAAFPSLVREAAEILDKIKETVIKQGLY